MAHELIDVVTATPAGPLSVGMGHTLDISCSFTLNGPTDATISNYDIAWVNTTDSVGFGTQSTAVANTVYTRTFTPTSVGTKILRCIATFNSDATPPNNNQVVNSTDITVVVEKFHEEPTPASTSWTEGTAPTAAFTEMRPPDPAMTEMSPPTTSWSESSAVGQVGTAFFLVSAGGEGTVDDYDLYVCSPAGIDTGLLEATAPPTSLKFKYVVCPLMPQFSPSAYYDLQRAAATEADYWHSSLPYDITTRIAPAGGVHWYIRPSADFGHRIADFFIDNFGAYFDGGYSDESTADIPDHYWTAWSGCDPADNGGVTAGRPYWETQWDEMFAAFLGDIKAAFGKTKGLIANTTGDNQAGIDGITIESSHIISAGEAATLVAFDAQRTIWLNSTNRYGVTVLNIAWDYPLSEARLVWEGTIG